jgi:ribosome-associated protein
MNEVSITTDMIKLDQFLKWAGITSSGSDAKELISEGCVKVNGELIMQRGKKLNKGDNISVDGYGEFIIV